MEWAWLFEHLVEHPWAPGEASGVLSIYSRHKAGFEDLLLVLPVLSFLIFL